MRKILASLAVIPLTIGPVSSQCHSPKPPVCASVVISQVTVTGHEADMPVTLCGMRRGSWQCVIQQGPLQANARLVCTSVTHPKL